LDERQRQHLDNATQENHLLVLKELQDEVVPWKECDKSRKRDLLSFWRTKWQWSRSVDELLGDEDRSGSMPWEVVRMIGHRGAGKTKRPVL
jgi:hypothetical protein